LTDLRQANQRITKVRNAFERGLLIDPSGDLKRALGGVVALEETLLRNGRGILEISSEIIEKLAAKLTTNK